MNTVIVINLDYEAFPITKCRKAWEMIESEMLSAGFFRSNRLFVTALPSKQAFQSAVEAMRRYEKCCDDQDLLLCVREFYGIPASEIVDLLQPAAKDFHVDVLSSASFPELFPCGECA